jgi:hypothetical protein
MALASNNAVYELNDPTVAAFFARRSVNAGTIHPQTIIESLPRHNAQTTTTTAPHRP